MIVDFSENQLNDSDLNLIFKDQDQTIHYFIGESQINSVKQKE